MSTPQGQRRIVVGVDGSPEALDAVRWAAAEATRRGASLRLVAAVEWLDRPAIGLPALGRSVAARCSSWPRGPRRSGRRGEGDHARGRGRRRDRRRLPGPPCSHPSSAAGSALFATRLAVAVAGVRPFTVLVPDPQQPSLLAVLRLGPASEPTRAERV